MPWPQLNRINGVVPKWYKNRQLNKTRNGTVETIDVIGVENKVAFSLTLGTFLIVFKGKFLSENCLRRL